MGLVLTVKVIFADPCIQIYIYIQYTYTFLYKACPTYSTCLGRFHLRPLGAGNRTYKFPKQTSRKMVNLMCAGAVCKSFYVFLGGMSWKNSRTFILGCILYIHHHIHYHLNLHQTILGNTSPHISPYIISCTSSFISPPKTITTSWLHSYSSSSS